MDNVYLHKSAIRATKIVSDEIVTSKGDAYLVKPDDLTISSVVVTDEDGNLTTSISNEELEKLSGIESNVQNQIDNKLSLSGGKMTGSILVDSSECQDFYIGHDGKNSNNGLICLKADRGVVTEGVSGETFPCYGSMLYLFSSQYQANWESESGSHKNMFILRSVSSTDDKTVYDLIGRNDGSLTWNGAEVLAPGEIKWHAGTSVPSGYLLCNGATVSRTTYARLFAAIGTRWGEGNGSTTFTLPNLINRVPWGSSTAGTYKAAGLPNITARVKALSSWLNLGTISTFSGAFHNDNDSEGGTPDGGYIAGTNSNVLAFDASRSNSIYGKSSTVQPPAATMMPIIKY